MFLKRVPTNLHFENSFSLDNSMNNDKYFENSSIYSSSYSSSSSGGDFMNHFASMRQKGFATSKKKSKTVNTTSTNVVKRFILNTMTPKYLLKNDTILVNVDEDLAILDMVDPKLHGKMGIIKDIKGDELEIEMIYENDEDIRELHLPRRVTIPIFCVCLEDRVLRSRIPLA
ncbi:hypothetical protein ABK040_009577 [Willaertia magna]